MRIGFIGAGKIGGTLAAQLATLGHEVAVSNSRGPETLAELVASIEHGAQAMNAADAARWGELLVVSVPFGHYLDVPVDGTPGKIVIDTNNYYPGRDGEYAELDADRTTVCELLAAHLPGARVVKAFNNINWEHLRDLVRSAGAAGRIGLPISGDDAEAKQVVAQLIGTIGFDAVDAGSLPAGGRKHQPGTSVYGTDLSTAKLRSALGV